MPLLNELPFKRPKFFCDTVRSIYITMVTTIAKGQTLQLVQDVAAEFDNYYLQKRYLTPEKN